MLNLMIKGTSISYKYHMYLLITASKLKGAVGVKKITSSQKLYVNGQYESTSIFPCKSDYIIFPRFNII